MNILVLGASGMLGNAMMRVLGENINFNVYGTVRAESSKRFFKAEISEKLITNIDVENEMSILNAFLVAKPEVVINCVGLIKQLALADDPLQAIPINALLPHQLAKICAVAGARFIHMSTDCVFSGSKGGYVEADASDAEDLYGKSKFLGEVDYPHAVTLRTSIIGHELNSKRALVDWFLSQENECNGFTKAIFSGFPTVVLAQIIRDVVIPKTDLTGVYHVAAKPISKFDLISLIADVYGKKIKIIPNDCLKIDRSLNAARFNAATGYEAQPWLTLIQQMHHYQ